MSKPLFSNAERADACPPASEGRGIASCDRQRTKSHGCTDQDANDRASGPVPLTGLGPNGQREHGSDKRIGQAEAWDAVVQRVLERPCLACSIRHVRNKDLARRPAGAERRAPAESEQCSRTPGPSAPGTAPWGSVWRETWNEPHAADGMWLPLRCSPHTRG